MTPPALTPEQEDQAQQQESTPSFLVTLEVTPEQAVRLVHGINDYTLYAGLRGSELKVDPGLAVSDLTILKGQVK